MSQFQLSALLMLKEGQASASVKVSLSFSAGSCPQKHGGERLVMKHARKRAQHMFSCGDGGLLGVLSVFWQLGNSCHLECNTRLSALPVMHPGHGTET